MIGLKNTFFGCKNIFQNNVFWLGKVLFVASLCRWRHIEQIRVFMWYNKIKGVIGCRTAHFYTLIKTKGKEYEQPISIYYKRHT